VALLRGFRTLKVSKLKRLATFVRQQWKLLSFTCHVLAGLCPEFSGDENIWKKLVEMPDS
jgi:hypothetical protein